jgi:hypothetical protein
MPAPNWKMGETITTSSPLSVRRLAASVNLALIIMNATLNPLLGFIEKTLVIAEFDVRKLHHDFTELITRAIQPALWLLLFGEVFARARALPTGSVPYLDFIAPGIFAQSVLFVAIFYGIAVIWERDLGMVQKSRQPHAPCCFSLGQGPLCRRPCTFPSLCVRPFLPSRTVKT